MLTQCWSHHPMPPLQGGSPAPRLVNGGGLEPLRASLAELALGDPLLREQLRASLAADGGLAGGARGQAAGWEEERVNMASPVLPSRPGSAVYSEDDSEGWSDEDSHEGVGRESSLAKRNLMEVLRSREPAGAAAAAAPRLQQHAYVHPQASLQHAARQQQAPQQASGHPGSRPGSAGVQPVAKATRVSLAQLMAAPASAAPAAAQPAPAKTRPASGSRPASAGSRPTSASARPASAAGRQALATRQNSGAKRGREALAASRRLSGKPPGVGWGPAQGGLQCGS